MVELNHVNGDQAGQATVGLTGVDRVLACIHLLASQPNGIGLDEVARGLASPKSSTHRALASLMRAGLVAQEDNRHYRLSLDFVRVAFSYYESLDRPRLVQAVLTELAEMFGETSHYAELDGDEIVYLAQARPHGERAQMTARIGGRNPAYCTGLGKALLAHALPDTSELERFVELHGPLARRTPKSLTTSRALGEELRATRERGYALDREESDPGITCIAFPVFLAAGTPTGAISISALASRTPTERLTSEADAVRRVIATHLGSGAVSGSTLV
jgi:IclR family acetate operon transcriptional repressor